MSDLKYLQKRQYLDIVQCLWDDGPEEANQEFPDISVKQFENANSYFDSLRCPGCYCGSCVGLDDLASNLDKSPEVLKPLAALAKKLGQIEFEE